MKSTVLIEIAADGFITVYGDDHVQVKIINRPLVSTAANGCRLDEWIDSILPRRYRDIRWPGNIRTYGQYDPVTLDGVRIRIDSMNAIEALNSLGGKPMTSIRQIQMESIS